MIEHPLWFAHLSLSELLLLLSLSLSLSLSLFLPYGGGLMMRTGKGGRDAYNKHTPIRGRGKGRGKSHVMIMR
jgi:hypothetical protein